MLLGGYWVDRDRCRSDPESVSFEEHVGDVFHALRTFHNAVRAMSDSPGTPSPYWAFLRFIVRRCHLKIAERMLNGEKIWKVHPMVVLHSWYPGGQKFERQEFPVRHQILQSMLSLYGIRPLHDGKQGGPGEERNSHQQYYYFANDNARDWAQVAYALYSVLEKRLFTPYFDGTIPPKNMPRASMDVESITTVADYLDTFSVMLDLPPMKAILSHELFVSKLELTDHGYVPTATDINGDHGELHEFAIFRQSNGTWQTARRRNKPRKSANLLVNTFIDTCGLLSLGLLVFCISRRTKPCAIIYLYKYIAYIYRLIPTPVPRCLR